MTDISYVCTDVGDYGERLGYLSPGFASYSDPTPHNNNELHQATMGKKLHASHHSAIETQSDKVAELGKMIMGINPLEAIA